MGAGDVPRDAAELVILSILAEGPSYGYAITRQAAARSDGEIRLTPGVLYPLLARLERDGHITSEWETVRSDRRPEGEEGRRRKWYRLSQRGQRRLATRIEAHRTRQRLLDRFISGVVPTDSAGEAT